MIHSNERIIKHKVGLLNLAEELGNVSKACQMMGLSRDTFYRYKAAVEEGGVEGLLEKACLENVRIQDLRHGYASRVLALGRASR